MGVKLDGADERGEVFRERVMAGAYEALGARGVAETVARAGAAPGLREEIGVVRVALARLLEEEKDASKFAAGVARLVTVAVQAARVEMSQGASGSGSEVSREMEEAVRRIVGG
ncbi:MAG: hypothetical protein ACR2J8_02030 [Thermomicrobiales bacterium]